MNPNPLKNSKLPYIIASAVFVVALLATQYLVFQQDKINQEEKQELLLHELNRVNDKFRNIISYNLIATNTLALFYTEYGHTKNFDETAAQLVTDNIYIDGVQLTQRGVITNVYPLKEYEKLLGTNIFKSPMLSREANIAVKKKEIFFAGPRKLRLGGYGILGKKSIFINDKLVGFITTVVKLSTIKKAIEPVSTTKKDEFTYTLIKKTDTGHQTSFNLSDVKPNKKSRTASIEIPRGNWILQIAYSDRYPLNSFPYTLSFFGIVISLFLAIFMYHQVLERNSLKETVNQKNYLLTERVKELSTLFQIEYILSDENMETDEKFFKVVKLIPHGFQFPDICQAKIAFADKIYTTEGYKESDINLVAKIDLPDDHNGIIKVVYTEKPSPVNNSSFFSEELHLIESIAQKTSVYLKKTFQKDALDRSEEQFKAAFEKAAIGKVLVGLDKKILTVNKSFCDMLGYTTGELLKMDFEQIIYPEDATKDPIDYGNSLKADTDSYRAEIRYLHKNGSVVWADVNVVIVRDKESQPSFFLLQIENITEKIESEANFKDLVEKSQVGVFILKEDKFVYVNQQIIHEIGYPEEEIIGSSYRKFIYDEDLHVVEENRQKRAEGIQNRFRYEIRVKRKDGSLIWAELYSSTTVYKGGEAVIGTMINKAEEKNAHAELEKSEANLKSIFNSTEVAYLLMDKDLTVISFNDHFNQYHLEQAGEDMVQDKNLIDQLPFEFRVRVKTNLQQVIELDKTSEYEEKSYCKSTNEIKYHQFTVSTVKNNDEIIGLCIACIDITAKKNLELEREHIINDLVIKNRDLEQFSYIVSHNMRAPLANLLGLVAHMENDDLSVEDYEFVRKAIHHSATTLDNVITDVNEILNFRKNHLQTKTVVDLTKVMDKVRIELGEVIGKTDAKTEYDFSAVSQIYTIEPYLHSIFLNLILNSLKFVSPDVDPEIKIWSEKIDGAVFLHFSDNGMGIDLKRYQEQLFGLYKKFDLSKEGKGMGLFIVKTQVNSLQGSISVKSSPGEGATFSIRLPLEATVQTV